MNNEINPNKPNHYNTNTQTNTQADQNTAEKQTVHVSRELDGYNDTGVIGEWLTVGTEHLADVNRFFIDKFRIAGLLTENLTAAQTAANVVKGYNQKILCADDMYVAGDPHIGGKGNNYQPLDVVPAPGYYTMFKDGAPNGRGITANGHVEVINNEGNVAFTEYGYIITDDSGKKYNATLSGGQLKITEPDGKSVILNPPNGKYIVGDPNDPVATFSFQDVPGGENGTNELRASIEYFEKPTAATVAQLVAKGVHKDDAEALRSRTQFTHGFRIPDGDGTYRASAGTNPPTPVTKDYVKTYYDSHFSEGKCQKADICEPDYEPPIYDGGDDGGCYGDPHFSDFDAKPEDGWTYDVMGEAGKTYSIISDRTVQLNARFDEWSGPDATIMSEMGIQVANPKDLSQVDRLYFDAQNDNKKLSNAAPTFNGVAMQANVAVKLADGGTAIWDGKHKMTVTTAEYTMTMDRKDSAHGGHMNMTAKITSGANPFADFVGAHGILGQTADGDGEIRRGDRGKVAQGGGALDTFDADGNTVRSQSGDKTLHNNYQTDGLFGTTHNAFNRFGVTVGTIIAKDTNGDGVKDTVLQVLDTEGNIIWGNLYEKLAPPQDAETTIAVIEDIQEALADEELAPEPEVVNENTGNAGGADDTLELPLHTDPEPDVEAEPEVDPLLLDPIEPEVEAAETGNAGTANAGTATNNTDDDITTENNTPGFAEGEPVPGMPVPPEYRVPASYDRNDPVDVFIRNQYRAILGREPEQGGFDTWVARLKGGRTNSEVTKSFFNSPEFKALNLNDTETYTRLIRGVLNRNPKEGDQVLLARLQNGESINSIIDTLYNSNEYKQQSAIVKKILEDNYGVLPDNIDGTGPLSQNPDRYVPPTPPPVITPPYNPPPRPGNPFLAYFQQLIMQFFQMFFGYQPPNFTTNREEFPPDDQAQQ